MIYQIYILSNGIYEEVFSKSEFSLNRQIFALGGDGFVSSSDNIETLEIARNSDTEILFGYSDYSPGDVLTQKYPCKVVQNQRNILLGYMYITGVSIDTFTCTIVSKFSDLKESLKFNYLYFDLHNFDVPNPQILIQANSQFDATQQFSLVAQNLGKINDDGSFNGSTPQYKGINLLIPSTYWANKEDIGIAYPYQSTPPAVGTTYNSNNDYTYNNYHRAVLVMDNLFQYLLNENKINFDYSNILRTVANAQGNRYYSFFEYCQDYAYRNPETLPSITDKYLRNDIKACGILLDGEGYNYAISKLISSIVTNYYINVNNTTKKITLFAFNILESYFKYYRFSPVRDGFIKDYVSLFTNNTTSTSYLAKVNICLFFGFKPFTLNNITYSYIYLNVWVRLRDNNPSGKYTLLKQIRVNENDYNRYELGSVTLFSNQSPQDIIAYLAISVSPTESGDGFDYTVHIPYTNFLINTVLYCYVKEDDYNNLTNIGYNARGITPTIPDTFGFYHSLLLNIPKLTIYDFMAEYSKMSGAVYYYDYNTDLFKIDYPFRYLNNTVDISDLVEYASIKSVKHSIKRFQRNYIKFADSGLSNLFNNSGGFTIDDNTLEINGNFFESKIKTGVNKNKTVYFAITSAGVVTSVIFDSYKYAYIPRFKFSTIPTTFPNVPTLEQLESGDKFENTFVNIADYSVPQALAITNLNVLNCYFAWIIDDDINSFYYNLLKRGYKLEIQNANIPDYLYSNNIMESLVYISFFNQTFIIEKITGYYNGRCSLTLIAYDTN